MANFQEHADSASEQSFSLTVLSVKLRRNNAEIGTREIHIGAYLLGFRDKERLSCVFSVGKTAKKNTQLSPSLT